jgi:hypothetical protein
MQVTIVSASTDIPFLLPCHRLEFRLNLAATDEKACCASFFICGGLIDAEKS